MPIWTKVYFIAFWPFLLCVCVVGIAKGDRPVRTAATLLLALMLLASPLVSTIEFKGVEVGLAATDIILLIGLTWCSMRAPRWWLIGMTSLQLLMTLGHASKLLFPEMSRLSYAIVTGGGAYFQVILLSIGTLLAIRSRRSKAIRSV